MKIILSIILFLSVNQAESNAQVPEDWGISTFFGAKERLNYRPILRGANYSMSSAHFREKSVPIYLSEAKRRNAPLVIWFPGVFGIADGRISLRMIQLFEERNVHVLSIPNFFNKTYIGRGPIYQENPSDTDIKVASDAIDFAVNKIGKHRIEKIHLVAESLGSFVAMGVLTQDQQKMKNLINGSLLLLYPPLEISHTIKTFDNLLKDYYDVYNNCSFLSWIFEYWKKGIYQKTYSNEFTSCTRAIMLHLGFSKTMEQVSKEFVDLKPQKGFYDFSFFLENYHPALIKVVREGGKTTKLGYWFDQLKISLPIQIVTARDDFLNWNLDWDRWLNERVDVKPDIHTFQQGGHCGNLGYQEGIDVILDFAKKVGW